MILWQFHATYGSVAAVQHAGLLDSQRRKVLGKQGDNRYRLSPRADVRDSKQSCHLYGHSRYDQQHRAR